MQGIEIRPGTVAEIEAIEELTLRSFPRIFQASLGNRPLEIQRPVLAGLRLAKRRPAEGILVAVNGPELVGVIMGSTREGSAGYEKSRLHALAPLGFAGSLRFLLVTMAIYSRYRPAPDEVYLYGLAVAPAYRRRGLARALVERAEEQGRQEGKALACCFAASTNSIMRTMLWKLGYLEKHVRRTPGRGLLMGEPAVVRLEKALTPKL